MAFQILIPIALTLTANSAKTVFKSYIKDRIKSDLVRGIASAGAAELVDIVVAKIQANADDEEAQREQLEGTIKSIRESVADMQTNSGFSKEDVSGLSEGLTKFGTMNGVLVNSLYDTAALAARAFDSIDDVQGFSENFARLEMIPDMSLSGAEGASKVLNFMQDTGAGVEIMSGLAALDKASTLSSDDILDYADQVRATFMALGLSAEDTLALSTSMQEQGVSPKEAESLWKNFSKILNGAGDSFTADGDSSDDNFTGNNSHLKDFAQIIFKRDSTESVTAEDIASVKALISEDTNKFYTQFLTGLDAQNLDSEAFAKELSHFGLSSAEIDILERISKKSGVVTETRIQSQNKNVIEKNIEDNSGGEAAKELKRYNALVSVGLNELPEKIVKKISLNKPQGGSEYLTNNNYANRFWGVNPDAESDDVSLASLEFSRNLAANAIRQIEKNKETDNNPAYDEHVKNLSYLENSIGIANRKIDREFQELKALVRQYGGYRDDPDPPLIMGYPH